VGKITGKEGTEFSGVAKVDLMKYFAYFRFMTVRSISLRLWNEVRLKREKRPLLSFDSKVLGAALECQVSSLLFANLTVRNVKAYICPHWRWSRK
jgi:hypothetical protein